MNVVVYLDTSESMGYGNSAKIEQDICLALGSLVIFDTDTQTRIKSASPSWMEGELDRIRLKPPHVFQRG
ncbi:MAG: hypothetical protein QXQ29_03735 [Candidatus Bathyarchaeia archaeon]